jgi:hypothetical protein
MSVDTLNSILARLESAATDLSHPDGIEPLTDLERRELAQSIATDADGIAQTHCGGTQPEDFWWVDDLNETVSVMRDLAEGRPLRQDDVTRRVLRTALRFDLDIEDREDVHPVDQASARRRAAVARRALLLAGDTPQVA